MNKKTGKSRMSIDEFSEHVIDRLREEIDNENVTITKSDVTKNNGITLHGIIIRDNSKSMAPTIYVDDAFREYMDGAELDECISKLKDVCLRSKNVTIDFSGDCLEHFENVSDKIFPKIINKDRNQQILAEVPHAEIGDLAVIFQIRIDEFGKDGMGTITINKKLAEMWGIKAGKLLLTSLKNLNRDDQIEIRSLFSVIRDIKLKAGDYDMDSDIFENIMTEQSPMMYVMSNSSGVNGAAGLVAEDKLAEFADRMDSDLYILPSSIHELIILLRKEADNKAEDLLQMVKEVNETQVSKEDFLSDNVYAFSRKDKSLSYAITGEKIDLKVA